MSSHKLAALRRGRPGGFTLTKRPFSKTKAFPLPSVVPRPSADHFIQAKSGTTMANTNLRQQIGRDVPSLSNPEILKGEASPKHSQSRIPSTMLPPLQSPQSLQTASVALNMPIPSQLSKLDESSWRASSLGKLTKDHVYNAAAATRYPSEKAVYSSSDTTKSRSISLPEILKPTAFLTSSIFFFEETSSSFISIPILSCLNSTAASVLTRVVECWLGERALIQARHEPADEATQTNRRDEVHPSMAEQSRVSSTHHLVTPSPHRLAPPTFVGHTDYSDDDDGVSDVTPLASRNNRPISTSPLPNLTRLLVAPKSELEKELHARISQGKYN
jgi:hypothetical protein